LKGSMRASSVRSVCALVRTIERDCNGPVLVSVPASKATPQTE